jgi:hypothetical protein
MHVGIAGAMQAACGRAGLHPELRMFEKEYALLATGET